MGYTKSWEYAPKKLPAIDFILLSGPLPYHCSAKSFPSVLFALCCVWLVGAWLPIQWKCKAKLLVFISFTGLAVKIIEVLRAWFNQDWEYMPLASVGAGMCLKSRVHLIYQISSMHEAEGLQKQQHDVLWPVLHGQSGGVIRLALTSTATLWSSTNHARYCEEICPPVCGMRLLGQSSWAADCWD